MSGRFTIWLLGIAAWVFGFGDRLTAWFLNGFDFVALTQLGTWLVMFGWSLYLMPKRGDRP